jgi:hypothetical protein
LHCCLRLVLLHDHLQPKKHHRRRRPTAEIVRLML